jgi:hypothetical protein
MRARDRIAQVLLWLAVLGLSVWVGGTPYQMLVIMPMWSASPTESVRAFFPDTRYNETLWNFFGPPFMAARLAPLSGALLAGWHLRRRPLSPRPGRLRVCRLRSRYSPPIEPAK